MKFFSQFFKKTEPSLYYLIEPAPLQVIGPWAATFSTSTEVVGYSSLGHVFLRSLGESCFSVLHPYKAAIKSYGKHESTEAFERHVLLEPSFVEYVLRKAHLIAVAEKVGRLKSEEIYFPQPYPLLGGSDAIETYDKGNVWVFLNLVAQMQSVGTARPA